MKRATALAVVSLGTGAAIGISAVTRLLQPASPQTRAETRGPVAEPTAPRSLAPALPEPQAISERRGASRRAARSTLVFAGPLP